MIERGKVVKIEGERTVVEMEPTSQCGACRACVLGEGGKMSVDVPTVPGVSVGDQVEVDIPVSRLRAIVTVFVLPLAAVLLGAVLGNYLTTIYMVDTHHPNLLAILFALVLVVLTYLGIYIHERTWGSRRSRPFIRQVE